MFFAFDTALMLKPPTRRSVERIPAMRNLIFLWPSGYTSIRPSVMRNGAATPRIMYVPRTEV